MFDTDTGAVLAGAVVSLDPGGAVAVADASGRFAFEGTPIGIYRVTASAPALETADGLVLESTALATAAREVVLSAGDTAAADLRLRRIEPERLNLIELHRATSDYFDVQNCVACHSDRTAELSRDPARKPFHSLATHAEAGCTFCHADVDLREQSGATARRQVKVATLCKSCHPNYPVTLP